MSVLPHHHVGVRPEGHGPVEDSVYFVPVDWREPSPVGAPLSHISGTFISHEDPVLFWISKVGHELFCDTCGILFVIFSSPVCRIGVVFPVKVWHMEYNRGAFVLQISVSCEFAIAKILINCA